jgi:uncharacterized cofD-like protein
MKIKRWFFLAVLGAFLIAAGFALLFLTGHLVAWWSAWGALDRLFGGASGRRLSVPAGLALEAFVPAQERADLASALYARRQQQKGPRVVGLGGGTGLATLLRGLKSHTANLTALVTVADNGGSSGRLRAEMGVLPPGDIRMCLVALADTEPLMERLFQYRFRNTGDGLSGHNFGNLFIAALTAITGDFEVAIKESSKVLAVRGQVLPSTLQDVSLRAELADGRVISGEADIPLALGTVSRVRLEPPDPPGMPEALAALEAAEVIVLGPGSLYTSVIPNLLVGGVGGAIRRSKAVKIYVCNVMTQPGETDGYTVADHVRAIQEHAGPGLIDCVLVNTRPVPEHLREKYREQGAAPVERDPERLAELGVVAVEADLASLTDLVRHDPDRLAQAILGLVETRAKAWRRGRER